LNISGISLALPKKAVAALHVAAELFRTLAVVIAAVMLIAAWLKRESKRIVWNGVIDEAALRSTIGHSNGRAAFAA
jgi:hypothetical protein